MHAGFRLGLLIVAASFVLERAAAACPFCGGKGATGLAENLLVVVGLWFGARALMRAMQRRQQRAAEREASPPDESGADPRQTNR